MNRPETHLIHYSHRIEVPCAYGPDASRQRIPLRLQACSDLSMPAVGDEITSVPELEAEILADPESYPDGSTVFVNNLDFPDESGTTVVTTGGWVAVWEGVPVPVYFPPGTTYKGWIANYPVPAYVPTYEADGGDGGGGFVVNIDGEPVPTNQVPGAGGGCNASIRTGNNNPETIPLDLQWQSDISIDDAAVTDKVDASASIRTGRSNPEAIPLDLQWQSDITIDFSIIPAIDAGHIGP